jgi:hypothetical protein
MLSLTDPVHTRLNFEDGTPPRNKIFPYAPARFFAEAESDQRAGITVKNPGSDMQMLAPPIEAEFKRTVKDKLTEAGRDYFIPQPTQFCIYCGHAQCWRAKNPSAMDTSDPHSWYSENGMWKCHTCVAKIPGGGREPCK